MTTLPELSKDQEIQFQNDVQVAIDKEIRPALMMDGGDMMVLGFNKLENSKYELMVQLVGACGSCPSSSMTMKMGVERMLLKKFDYLEAVTQSA